MVSTETTQAKESLVEALGKYRERFSGFGHALSQGILIRPESLFAYNHGLMIEDPEYVRASQNLYYELNNNIDLAVRAVPSLIQAVDGEWHYMRHGEFVLHMQQTKPLLNRAIVDTQECKKLAVELVSLAVTYVTIGTSESSVRKQRHREVRHLIQDLPEITRMKIEMATMFEALV